MLTCKELLVDGKLDDAAGGAVCTTNQFLNQLLDPAK